MPLFDDPPLHNFPDRSIRKLLEDVRNLRELLLDAMPHLAPFFLYEQAVLLPRSFLLEDWREREADLFYRIPFRAEGMEGDVLVCILLEHQSQPDPRMSLRTLLYTVLYWEQEWKEWEKDHAQGEPLKLTPVLPIVFHTGTERWRSHRELFDLMNGPELFRPYIPQWQSLFWDLAEQTPEALLEKAGAWMQALAVVRAETADTETFEHIFEEALRKVGELGEQEGMRRHDLLWFMLSWAIRRRDESERKQLEEVAKASQRDAGRQKEIEAMAATIGETWEQRTFREIEESRREGEARGEARASRTALRVLLEERFGTLSEEMDEQLEGTEDVERLRAALRQAVHVSNLSEFKL